MKLAISMWSVHRNFNDGKMNILDFINFVDTLDIEGVELLDVFWNDVEQELPEVLDLLDEKGLQVGAYAVSNDFVQSDVSTREEQVEAVKKGIDIAVKLKTKVLRVFSGNMEEGVTFEKAKGWIIDSLVECARYASEKGITLGLENHGLFAGKSSQVQSIIDEVGSDSLRATFDAGNFLLVDESPVTAIDELSEVTTHVHAKDFLEVDYDGDFILESLAGKKFLGTVCGEGQVELDYILNKLSDEGYQGWLSVEFEGAEDEKDGSTRSINHLKELLK